MLGLLPLPLPRFFARGRPAHLFNAACRPPAAVFSLATHQVGRETAKHDPSVHLEAVSEGSSGDHDASSMGSHNERGDYARSTAFTPTCSVAGMPDAPGQSRSQLCIIRKPAIGACRARQFPPPRFLASRRTAPSPVRWRIAPDCPSRAEGTVGGPRNREQSDKGRHEILISGFPGGRD